MCLSFSLLLFTQQNSIYSFSFPENCGLFPEKNKLNSSIT